MHFIYEKTDLHLHRFLEKIGQRPQTWRVISLEFQDGETVQSPLFQDLCRTNLHDIFKEVDARIFWHKPGFILVFFQGRVAPIEDCVKKLLKETEFKGVKRFFDVLDLSIHWKNLIQLVDQVTLSQVKSVTPINSALSIKTNASTTEDFQISLSPDIIKYLKPSRASRQKPLIMIVEDNPVVLLITKSIVEKHFDVVMAETVLQALVYYQRHLPDMVLLDINLPDGDGVELLQEIREADSEAHIVMLSGERERKKILTTLKLGAQSFITKPLAEQDLVDAINEFLYQKDEQLAKQRTKPKT